METEIKIRKNSESLMLVQQRMSGTGKGEQQNNWEDIRNPERYYLFIYRLNYYLIYLLIRSFIHLGVTVFLSLYYNTCCAF